MSAIKVNSKSLGIVQIMIGVVILAFGIILKDIDILGIRSGIMFWGSLCFVITGFLSAAVVDCHNSSMVNSSLLANVISTVAAIVAIILFSVDLWQMDSTMQNCLNSAGDECNHMGFIYLFLLRPMISFFLAFSLMEVFIASCTFVLVWKSRDSPEAMFTP